MKEAQEYLSSTGTIGRNDRPFNRVFENLSGIVTSSQQALNEYKSIEREVENRPEISRGVVRGVMEGSVLSDLIHSYPTVTKHLETAVKITGNGFSAKDYWLFNLGVNSENRKTNFQSEVIVYEASQFKNKIKPEIERIQEVKDGGYTFKDSTVGFEESLFSLWGETFGWTMEEIINLSGKLEQEKDLPREHKTVWVSLITDGENVVAASMAERLQLPIGDGKFLDLIESTEWRTREGFQGQGLMTSSLIYLNAHITKDLMTGHGTHPFIFAECNHARRSQDAAHGARFERPDTQVFGQMIPQVNFQNVKVADGVSLPSELRDFSTKKPLKEGPLPFHQRRPLVKEFLGFLDN